MVSNLMLKMFACTSHGGFTLYAALLCLYLSMMTTFSQSPECRCNPAPESDGSFAVGDSINFCCGSTYGNEGTRNFTYYKGKMRVAGPGLNLTCYRFDLAPEDNGINLTCIVTTSALDEQCNCSLMPLRILPNATILPAASRPEVGSYATFECYGEGVPGIAHYTWTAIISEDREAISSENYTLLADGRVMVMKAQGDFELFCAVRVPSGLSGNSSVISVEVTDPAGPTATPCPGAYPIAAVLAVQAAVTVAALASVWCLWKRMQKIKPPAPHNGSHSEQRADEGHGAAFVEAGHENQDHAYATVDNDEDAAAGDSCANTTPDEDPTHDTSIISEYLDLRDSPRHNRRKNTRQEYAYAYASRSGNTLSDEGTTGKSHDTSIISEYLELRDMPTPHWQDTPARQDYAYAAVDTNDDTQARRDESMSADMVMEAKSGDTTIISEYLELGDSPPQHKKNQECASGSPDSKCPTFQKAEGKDALESVYEKVSIGDDN